MFSAASYDPFFFTRIRHEHPRFHPNHIGLVRAAHATSMEDLEHLDRELEVLTARRRQVLDRLSQYRRRLWPGMAGRHHRKTCRLEDEPLPPAVVDAAPLWGGDLRRVIVAIVRRHGAVTLREIHGLIHRYGYRIESRRPVQRLGDAAAFEVRHGRMERVGRGVYGPVPVPVPGIDEPADVLGAPLPWSNPAAPDASDDMDDVGRYDGAVDPSLLADPQRWSAGRWPEADQLGAEWCEGDPDPFVRDLAEDLDATVAAAHERLAAVYSERLGGPPIHYEPRATRTDLSRWPLDPPHPRGASEKPLGNDSSTNRSPMGSDEGPERWGDGRDGPPAGGDDGEGPPGSAPE